MTGPRRANLKPPTTKTSRESTASTRFSTSPIRVVRMGHLLDSGSPASQARWGQFTSFPLLAGAWKARDWRESGDELDRIRGEHEVAAAAESRRYGNG